MADNLMDLQVNTALLEEGAQGFSGLAEAIGQVKEAMDDAFTVAGYKDYLKTVQRFGKDLANELLVLQLSFGKMKVAITDSVAPIAAVFMPMLNQAVRAVTHFANSVGQFFQGLILGMTGQDALAKSAEQAVQAEENLASSAVVAGSAVRRSLMGFDEINRLSGSITGGSSTGSNSGSSSNTPEIPEILLPDTVSPQVQTLVDGVLAALQPLLAINLEPLRVSVDTLAASLSHLGQLAGTAIHGLWFDVLIPFAAWITEQLAPALTEFFAAKLEMVVAATEPLMAGMAALHEAMQPVFAFISQQVLTSLTAWQGAFESLAAVFREKGPQMTGILQNLSTVVTSIWNGISPVLSAMSRGFSQTFTFISNTVTTVTRHLIDALTGVSTYLAGVFTGNWQQAWDGVVGGLRGVVNTIISLLNSMLSRFVSAINTVISGANSLSFSIPDWVPLVGGKTFSPNIGYVSAPQIPYLAQGAVLPANRPFMAVVGDQRHGTNVEAPLATIEQAVAGVMQDQIASNMAGHEATVAVLREILGAVMGIRIGDDTIALAVDRYQRKMAIMKGV